MAKRKSLYCSDPDFAEWAFGKGTWDAFMVLEADVIDLIHAWNKLHGTDLLIEEEEAIPISLKKMNTLYKEKRTRDSLEESDDVSTGDKQQAL